MRHTLSDAHAYTARMAAKQYDRVKRLERLVDLLPSSATAPAHCLDGARLLEILGDAYGDASPESRRRTLQRDLETLVAEGRIEIVNPGGKPLRYRRRSDDLSDDPLIRAYDLRRIADLVAEAVPARRLDRLLPRLLHEPDGPLLDEQRLRIVPDGVRLHPVDVYEKVLYAVIVALAQRCVLEVKYQDAAGVRAKARLHPHALVQRGPIPYLFAVKNDESEPMRLYALHRMLSAKALMETPARIAQDFDLDRSIAEGKADFGQGEWIDLELRVRGYLATVLSVCKLSDDQKTEDEPHDSPFELRVRARVPSTGQLLRWLLGAGPNLEVLAPPELRHTVSVQAAKIAAIYQAD
jgi:predicted DNA-binding transcriptional regulator YafY